MEPSFSTTDIAEQTIAQNDLWLLILPRQPIYKYHLLAIIKRNNAHVFTDLTDDELGKLREVIHKIVNSLPIDFCYSGYNLFCNNGQATGQHINQFHMHIFVRSSHEQESPYKLLNSGKTWHQRNTNQWKQHKEYLKSLLT